MPVRFLRPPDTCSCNFPYNGHSVLSPLFQFPARALDVFMALFSVASIVHGTQQVLHTTRMKFRVLNSTSHPRRAFTQFPPSDPTPLFSGSLIQRSDCPSYYDNSSDVAPNSHFRSFFDNRTFCPSKNTSRPRCGCAPQQVKFLTAFVKCFPAWPKSLYSRDLISYHG